MSIVRSSPHPESARHLLQVRAGPEGSRVVLVEFERPRRGGDVLSEVESGLLRPPEAKALHVRARLVPLQDVPALLHAARPKSPATVEPRGGTKRIPPVTLTANGLEALTFLVQWLQDNQRERPTRSTAVNLAVQEAARSRGWNPPVVEPAPEEQA